MKIPKALILVLSIMLIGLALRLVAATTLPLTNDEGSYLYDAYLLGQGRLPFLTSFSRAPGLMAPLALWLKVAGISVLGGRLLAILASLGSAVLLYFIGRELKNKTLGFWALTLYAVVSPAAIHGSYLLTQQFEIFYALFGSLLLLRSVRTNKLGIGALFSGVFFGLAIATRETAVIYPVLLATVLLIISWREKRVINCVSTIAMVAAGTILTWFVIWGLVASQVGLEHVARNFEAILKMHDTGEKLSLGFILRRKIGEFWYLRFDYAIFYVLTIVFGVTSIVRKWWQEQKFWLLLAVALGPILFYGLYYKRIQPEYFASFMPGMALMGAWVVDQMTESRKQIAFGLKIFYLLSVICFLCLNILTFKYQLQNPRGGTFYLKSLDQIVSWIKENTSPDDEIFTAAVAIPLLSERHLALDISRPVLFGYPHIKPDIKYTLFPTVEEITAYLSVRKVKYYLVEKSTRDTFYTGHDDLKKYLEESYQYRERFDNPTNPLELWERKT